VIISPLIGGKHVEEFIVTLVTIDTARLHTYEIGAFLLTLLADPEHQADARNVEVQRTLCARALWFAQMDQPEDPDAEIQVRSEYLWKDPAVVNREVRRIGKVLGARMIAGRMAQFYIQPLVNPDFKLPPSLKRRSLNEVAAYVLADAGQADAKNVIARMWRPSRPVIHLCAAAAFVAQERIRSGVKTGLETFLLDPLHLAAVLRVAQDYETIVDSDPSFPGKGTDLTRLRLI
jgi:hypothetical protein